MKALFQKANEVFNQHQSHDVWFERSIFTNWTCAIADCKYCYLSTKPKLKMNAVRSMESILAETLVCKIMGWRVGYLTGGLRVETNEQLIELAANVNTILGHKTMMNYGPYSKKAVEQFATVLSGMGCAVESFDEELHNYICPSKPLKALLKFLEHLETYHMKKLITIILGLGESKIDSQRVIENIKKYRIDTVQLCFLKPQKGTIYEKVPPPDPQYMAWWIATLRIALPQLKIKVALVRETLPELSLLLHAGANCFSRFMVFQDFGGKYASMLENECIKAKRNLIGHFTKVPNYDLDAELNPLDLQKKAVIKKKTQQYFKQLVALAL